MVIQCISYIYIIVMVYNKSKNPVTILTYYVRFSSQFCQWHNLNFKQLHQSLQVANLFFLLLKKTKYMQGVLKYIAYWTICTVYIQKFKLSRYLQIHVCLQISCLIYTGISYRYNFLSTNYIASFILANAQSFQMKISVIWFFLGKKTHAHENSLMVSTTIHFSAFAMFH